MRLGKLTGPREIRPPRTGAPDYLGSLALADSTAAIADMIKQVQRDSSGIALRRYLLSEDFGEAWYHMRTLGEDWRGEIAYRIDCEGGRFGIRQDARRDVHYSGRVLVDRLTLLLSAERQVLTDWIRNWAFGNGWYLPLTACLLTRSTTRGAEHPALMFADRQETADMSLMQIKEMRDRWTWQAAQVLGKVLIHPEHFGGAMVPEVLVLPPNPHTEAIETALLHRFAKAFLLVGDEDDARCDARASCVCNSVLDMANQAPARHPDNTDYLLLADIDHEEAERARHMAQITPPPGRSPARRVRQTRPMPPIDDEADAAGDDDPDLDPDYPRTPYHARNTRKAPTMPPRNGRDDTERLDRK